MHSEGPLSSVFTDNFFPSFPLAGQPGTIVLQSYCLDCSDHILSGVQNIFIQGSFRALSGEPIYLYAFNIPFSFSLSFDLLNKGTGIIIPIGKINKQRLRELK